MTILLEGRLLATKRKPNFRTLLRLRRFVFGASNIVRQPTLSPKIPICGNVVRIWSLFHVGSIEEIVSQATVSHELHQALEKALRASEYLSETLADEIRSLDINVSRTSLFGRGGIEAARIENVDFVYVASLNVESNGDRPLLVSPKLRLISLEIVVEIEGRYREFDDYEPPQRQSISRSKIDYFYPEIIVRFEPSTGELEFELISFAGQSVHVGIDDVERSFYR